MGVLFPCPHTFVVYQEQTCSLNIKIQKTGNNLQLVLRPLSWWWLWPVLFLWRQNNTQWERSTGSVFLQTTAVIFLLIVKCGAAFCFSCDCWLTTGFRYHSRERSEEQMLLVHRCAGWEGRRWSYLSCLAFCSRDLLSPITDMAWKIKTLLLVFIHFHSNMSGITTQRKSYRYI